jgi:hypothetical protein
MTSTTNTIHYAPTSIPPLAALQNLTDLNEITAMLARIDRRSAELDEELTSFSKNSHQIDTKLRKAEQLAYVCVGLRFNFGDLFKKNIFLISLTIHPVQEESKHLASKIAQTSLLAENVSKKVRSLDKTRVNLIKKFCHNVDIYANDI